jgi:hypothetical protein
VSIESCGFADEQFLRRSSFLPRTLAAYLPAGSVNGRCPSPPAGRGANLRVIELGGSVA